MPCRAASILRSSTVHIFLGGVNFVRTEGEEVLR